MRLSDHSIPDGEKTISLYIGGKLHTVRMSSMRSGPDAGSILCTHTVWQEERPAKWALLPCSAVRGGVFHTGAVLDALGITGFDSAHCDEGTGNSAVNRESLFCTDSESIYLIPKLNTPMSLGGRPISIWPEGPFRPVSKEEVFAGRNAYLARYRGRQARLVMTGFGGVKHCTVEEEGVEREKFDLSASDIQTARDNWGRFEEIRPALFQVRVGGVWYWIDNRWGRGEDMIVSVYGGRPVPELAVTHPGRFEIEWKAGADQITEARALVCNSILDDLFDI